MYSFFFQLKFEIQSGSKGIVGDISMALHDRPGHIDSLYPTISGRKLVKFPSQVRKNLPSTKKSRKVRIQFETNYVEKLSHGSLPCEKEDVNDYCLEQVVERDAKCYLPWGLGLATGTVMGIIPLKYGRRSVLSGRTVFPKPRGNNFCCSQGQYREGQCVDCP